MAFKRHTVSNGTEHKLRYVLVWCVAKGRPILHEDSDLKKRLEALLYEKAAELKGTIHALEIMPDHVHMFFEADPTLAPAHIAAQFKGFTSRILREEFPWLKSRLPSLWSRSYYVGSVGHVSEATIKKYIENQKS